MAPGGKRSRTARPPAPVTSRPGLPALLWLVLLAVTFAVYVPSLRNGFSYDDRGVITEADYLLSHPSLAPRLATADYFALSGESTYRPTLTLTYMLDRSLGGGEPWMFHLDSVLWHLAAVALLYALLLRLRAGTWLAFAIAVLFALHAALTEAVDGVAFREDVLSTALGLAALLAFVGTADSQADGLSGRLTPTPASAASDGGPGFSRPGRRSEGRAVRIGGRHPVGRCLLGGILLLLAQLAKESAFTFVAIIPITLWYVDALDARRLRPVETVRAHRRALIAATGSGLAFLLLRFVAFPSRWTYGEFAGGSFWTGAATGVMAIGHYLRLLVVPAPLCADYRGVIAPVTSLADGRLWIAAAAIAGIAAAAWRLRRAEPLVAWGVAIFFIGLAPVANLVPIPVPIAERFLYLPFIGGITAGVAGLDRLRRAMDARVPVGVGLLAAALAGGTLAFLTWQRHPVWASNETLWTTTLAEHPNAYGAMHGLANVRLDQDRFAESAALLQRALAAPIADPNQRAGILDALGITYASEGRFEEAVPVFNQSLALGEGAKTHYNLGVTLLQLGRVQEGETHLRRALALNPYYARPYPLLIELARRRGDNGEASRLERQQPLATR